MVFDVSKDADAGSNPAASTPLGKRIREIRARMEANGERFLSWDEIDAELDRERDERLMAEAKRILLNNCSCKTCMCSGRTEGRG